MRDTSFVTAKNMITLDCRVLIKDFLSFSRGVHG
jgi:hypothetical protein